MRNNNIVKIKAWNEYSKIEVEKGTPTPEIINIKRLYTNSKSAKYGENITLDIRTSQALGCQIEIVISCDDWIKDYVMIGDLSNRPGPMLPHGEGVTFTFALLTDLLKDTTKYKSKTDLSIKLLKYDVFSKGAGFKNSLIFDEKKEAMDIDYGGYFYLHDGTYIRRIGESEDVYVLADKNAKDQIIILDSNNNPIQYKLFIEIAGWAYNENTEDIKAQKASLGMLKNWITAKELYDGFDKVIDYRTAMNMIYKTSGASKDSETFSYQRKFIKEMDENRNNKIGMKNAVAALIHVLKDGKDFSYGAVQEHGRDFFIQYKKDGKTEWPMYTTQQAQGYDWLENGNFEGIYTPKSKPKHMGTVSKKYKYLITASYHGNIYTKFSKEYERKKKKK